MFVMAHRVLNEYEVYNTRESADILQLNDATVQRLIRDHKLDAKVVGNKYLISGKSLMKFMNIRPDLYSSHTAKRPDLIFYLNEAIENLHKLSKNERIDMGVILHQSINMYADDITLENILVDIRRQIDLRKNKKVK